MARVFCFEETHLDISGLKKFGEILYVFYSREIRRPLPDMQLEDQIISQLTRFKFDPDEDFVAIVGQQLPLAIYIGAVVATYGQIRSLCFDARNGEYYERSMGHLVKEPS